MMMKPTIKDFFSQLQKSLPRSRFLCAAFYELLFQQLDSDTRSLLASGMRWQFVFDPVFGGRLHLGVPGNAKLCHARHWDELDRLVNAIWMITAIDLIVISADDGAWRIYRSPEGTWVRETLAVEEC